MEVHIIKKLIAFGLTLVLALSMVGCSRTMNDIIENELSIVGIVEEVYDDHVILYTEQADGYPYGANWTVPLDVEIKDSYTDIKVGDEIVVYHNGVVAETDPLEIQAVYAITLKTPAKRETNNDNNIMFGIVGEVLEIYEDSQCKVEVTGSDENFNENEIVMVELTENTTSENYRNLMVGSRLAITYSVFEKTADSSKIIAGQIEYVE